MRRHFRAGIGSNANKSTGASMLECRSRVFSFFHAPSLGATWTFRISATTGVFQMVVLANGAWRDRQLGIPGAEEFIGKGLVYQNAFIHRYNHKNEEGYTAPRYQYVGSDHVFGVGNVVTGQGNIRASLIHSQEVTTKIIESYIRVPDRGSSSRRFYAGAEAQGAAHAQAVRDRVQVMSGLSYLEIAALEQRIRILQERVGYTGDYDSWIASVTPAVPASQNFAPESMHQSSSSSAAFHCGACR